jgi:hypothetical protein
MIDAGPVLRRHCAAMATTRYRPGEQALDEPRRAFPSWFLRIVC